MPERPSSVLPWTPAEEAMLRVHAQLIHDLREKVEQGNATHKERQQYETAVKAIKKAIEEKKAKENSKDLLIDLSKVREQWVNFYTSHHLDAILKDAQGKPTIPDTIRLTQAQKDILKQRFAEGYTRIILVPAGIDQHLNALKTQLADGYEKDGNGAPIETYLGNPKDSFPNEITTTDPNRKQGAYLLLTKPDEALHPNSKGKTADALLAEFAQENLTGLTLADFFIEQREHFEKTGTHLIDGATIWSWLLSSRDNASRVLSALWDSSVRRVGMHSVSSGSSDSDLGARSSVVLHLDP